MSFVTGVTGRVYAGSSMVHLVGVGDGGGDCASVEGGGVWKSGFLPLNLAVNLKLL